MADETTKAKPKTKRAPRKKSASAASAAPIAPARLRLRVRGYDHKVLDQSVKQIIDTALRFDAEVVGPIPLPTDIRKFTVNASTFVYKDAREQFEIRTHKRIIDIVNPDAKVVDALTNLSLPSGVQVDVRML